MTFPAGFSKVHPVDARSACGDVAQLGEHCLRKAGVESSNLFISTTGISGGQPYMADRLFSFGANKLPTARSTESNRARLVSEPIPAPCPVSATARAGGRCGTGKRRLCRLRGRHPVGLKACCARASGGQGHVQLHSATARHSFSACLFFFRIRLPSSRSGDVPSSQSRKVSRS